MSPGLRASTTDVEPVVPRHARGSWHAYGVRTVAMCVPARRPKASCPALLVYVCTSRRGGRPVYAKPLRISTEAPGREAGTYVSACGERERTNEFISV